jgi:hypothetical protein
MRLLQHVGLVWMISNENLSAHFPNEFSLMTEELADLLEN